MNFISLKTIPRSRKLEYFGIIVLFSKYKYISNFPIEIKDYFSNAI